MQRLSADLAEPLQKSTGNAQFSLMIVADATNMGWPVNLALGLGLGFVSYLSLIHI